MDNTVCDFWRMIWEQHLELILMLTNLEEYSKTKCAKYWPDEADGEKIFGDISVSHVQEKRYSGIHFIQGVLWLKACNLGDYSNSNDEEKRLFKHVFYSRGLQP